MFYIKKGNLWVDMYWNICPQTGRTYSRQTWSGRENWAADLIKWSRCCGQLQITNQSKHLTYTIDARSEYEMRKNPRPHIMLANGERLLI